MDGAPASRRGRQPRPLHPRAILAPAPRSVNGRRARILRNGPTSTPPSVLLCIFVFTALTSLASYISTPLSSPPKLARTSCPGRRPCWPASPWGTTAGSLHRRSTRRLPSDRRPHRIPAGRCPPRHRLPSGSPRSLQTATRGKALAAHDISTSVWRGSWLRDVLCWCDIMGAADGAINVCFEGAEDLPGGGDCKRTMSSQRNPRQMTRRRTRRWISQQRSARLLTTPVTRMTDIHKELGEFTRTTRRQHMAGFCVHTPGQMVNITWGDILQEHNKGIFDMEFEDLDGDEDNLGQEGTKILFGGKYLYRET